jgi:hypothetical protein
MIEFGTLEKFMLEVVAMMEWIPFSAHIFFEEAPPNVFRSLKFERRNKI